MTISATIHNHSYSFLLDTGSVISLIPFHPDLPPLRTTGVSLQTASNSPIKCYGELDTIIAILSLQRTFPWTFVVAEISQYILGVDFLSEHNLTINCTQRTLTDSLKNHKISLKSSFRDSDAVKF